MCECVSMCKCASSVGVNNVHNIVAIPNVLVSHLGLPWGVCPYPRTYSWCGFNKHCRCEAIESLQDCSQWQFMCHTECKWALQILLGPSIYVRLRHNGRGLQVADIIVLLYCIKSSWFKKSEKKQSEKNVTTFTCVWITGIYICKMTLLLLSS